MEGYTNFTKLHAETFHADTVETDSLELTTKLDSIANIANDANGTAIATAVNALIARLVAAGILEVEKAE